jgi:hypothetical protein
VVRRAGGAVGSGGLTSRSWSFADRGVPKLELGNERVGVRTLVCSNSSCTPSGVRSVEETPFLGCYPRLRSGSPPGWHPSYRQMDASGVFSFSCRSEIGIHQCVRSLGKAPLRVLPWLRSRGVSGRHPDVVPSLRDWLFLGRNPSGPGRTGSKALGYFQEVPAGLRGRAGAQLEGWAGARVLLEELVLLASRRFLRLNRINQISTHHLLTEA